MSTVTETLVNVASLEELRRRGTMVVAAGRHGLALFDHNGAVYAVDNRCPHMGFPLSRGSVCDGILTCHWHHARFDLESGGTFDPFADDVRVYPTRVVDGDVWVDLRAQSGDPVRRWKERLRDGLEQNLSLVVIKSVLALRELDVPSSEIMEVGGAFGSTYRDQGWGPGLTILTALGNALPALAPEDQALALYHGLVRVAQDCAGQAPRFPLDPLPTRSVGPERLKAWFRQFVEVRDAEGAERALLTAIQSGQSESTIADMLCAAATDHYFHAGGHTLDFVNKAFELVERTGWDQASVVLPSVIGGLARGQRSEEQNAWRHPIDLVALVEPVLAELPALLAKARDGGAWGGFEELARVMLTDDPAAIVGAVSDALRQGATLPELSQTLAYAAALRVARFHTSNEFGDWITVLHTFTYCNALDRCVRRSPSPELARGIYHGALKVYLDRFLNMPAAALPDDRVTSREPRAADELLTKLRDLMDREQQVNPAAAATAAYVRGGHDDTRLIDALGHTLLREDAEFHTYQMFEAGVQQYRALKSARPDAAGHVLVAVARYLAAHAPTSRAMLQTARIAMRLHRGEALFEDVEEA